ncbi:MAG: hypothetical protein ACLQVD_20730 [Capsulimonadaceae bacterium]
MITRRYFASNALVCFTVVMVVWNVASNQDILANAHPNVLLDMDIQLIAQSLATKPTFASTFTWWHSNWELVNPFWRPLTMQVFWMEKHCFTLQGFRWWQLVTGLMELISLALYAWFVRLLTRRTDMTCIAVLTFAGPRLGLPIDQFLSGLWHTTPINVATAWKDQPDIFADTFLFASLICLLKKRYAPGLVFAFISVSFKESGWMVWFIALVLLAIRGELRALPRWVFVAAAIEIAALIALRYSAGPAVFRGADVGSNRHWFTRYVGGVGGDYAEAFRTLPFCFVLAHAIFLTTRLSQRFKDDGLRRRIISGVTLCAGMIATLFVQARFLGAPLWICLASYTDPVACGYYLYAVLSVLLILSATWAISSQESYRKLGGFALASALITGLPYAAATQVLEHALRQSYAFQSLLVAVAALALWDRWSIVLPKPAARLAVDGGDPTDRDALQNRGPDYSLGSRE